MADPGPGAANRKKGKDKKPKVVVKRIRVRGPVHHGATPERALSDVLRALAPRLARLGNQIAVEGHTDARAYPTRSSYGNWELSADRANVARRG